MNRSKFSSATVAAALLVALFSIPAVAENTYYRWLDDRGNPVHSDRPPPKGIDYEVVSTGTNLMRRVDAEEGAVPPEVEPRVGNEFESASTEPPKIEKNPEFCKRAKENLETLNRDIRIRMRDENGEYYYLDEEQKAEQKRSAEQAIATHCE